MEIASASEEVQLLAQSSGEHDNTGSDVTFTQPPRVKLTIGPKKQVFLYFTKETE